MTGETQVTISDPDGVKSSVTIWCTKLDHNLDKPLTIIEDVRQDIEDTTSTTLVDIGKVKQVITVQGFLHDETTGTEATDSGFKKKENLLALIINKKSVTITWGTGVREQSYTGNINKCGFTETAGIVGEQDPTAPQTENTTKYRYMKNFAVQFAIIVGTPYGE